MAELILSDEEKQAISWFDVSDDTLVNILHKIALRILTYLKPGGANAQPSTEDEIKSFWLTTAAFIMVNHVIDNNSNGITFTLDGMTLRDEQLGDWVIRAERVFQKQEDAASLQDLSSKYPGLTDRQLSHLSKTPSWCRDEMAGYLTNAVDVGVAHQNECGPYVPPFAIFVVANQDFYIECCDSAESAKQLALDLGLRVVNTQRN